MNRYHILSVCCTEEKITEHHSRHQHGISTDSSDAPPNTLSSNTSSTILGFLSNLDILFYLSENLLLFDLEEFGDGPQQENVSYGVTHSTEPTLRQCLNRPIKYLMHQKLETEHYHTVHESESVWSVVEGKFALGVHRVIVMREDAEQNPHNQDSSNTSLVGMITQSDIIKFALNSEWRDEPFHVRRFLDTMWRDREVIAVYEDDTLIEALKQMAMHSLSAVAVVESRTKRPDSMEDLDEYQRPLGRLVANFSASDLRRIIQEVSPQGDTTTPPQQNDHTQTISQFFTMKISDYLNKFSKRSLAPITISSTDDSMTMRGIVELFGKEKIHRVWIVDEQQCPRGLLSLTDLCEFVAQTSQ